MISRHKQIDTDDAEPGMVLSAAVLDARGAVLAAAGAALTDAMLTAMHRRGICSLLIVNDAVPEEELLAERERLRQRMSLLFRKCKAGAAREALWKQVMAYRLGEAP
jgi:hypothetical protein